MREPETFRTFYADPGEDFGWCMGRDLKLLAGGTDKMWNMPADLEDALLNPYNGDNQLNSVDVCRDSVDPVENQGPIGRIVCEDWKLYPWKLLHHQMDWDPCRTARVIGALTYLAQKYNITLVLQGAKIKKAAIAAGAPEYYLRPLRENRHQNDAIQHFVFFTNVELLDIPLIIPDDDEVPT